MEIKSKEIVILENKTKKALMYAEGVKVTTDDELLKVGEFRKEIKEIAKAAKQEKEKATKPLNDVLKTVRGWFAPIEENCDKILVLVDNAMLKYQNEVDAKRRKAEAEAQKKIDDAQRALEEGRITEEQANKKIEKVETKLETVPEAMTKSSGTFHTRVDRKIKFADLNSLDADQLKYLVAGEYIIWDEVKGRKDALAGVLKTGVEIYEQKSLI